MAGESNSIDPRIPEILLGVDSDVFINHATKHLMDGWSMNAVAYDLLYQDLGLVKSDDYRNKDGFQVLIPRILPDIKSLTFEEF